MAKPPAYLQVIAERRASLLAGAHRRSVPLAAEIQGFMEQCPGRFNRAGSVK